MIRTLSNTLRLRLGSRFQYDDDTPKSERDLRLRTYKMPLKSPKDVVSVDVEDYFHAETWANIVQRSQWDQYSCRVEANTRRLLDLFAERQIHSTFFVIGWVAERFPRLIRDIAAGGHELACHSYWHRLIYRLDPREFREDTQRAKDMIEQTAGVPIYGY